MRGYVAVRTLEEQGEEEAVGQHQVGQHGGPIATTVLRVKAIPTVTTMDSP